MNKQHILNGETAYALWRRAEDGQRSGTIYGEWRRDTEFIFGQSVVDQPPPS